MSLAFPSVLLLLQSVLQPHTPLRRSKTAFLSFPLRVLRSTFAFSLCASEPSSLRVTLFLFFPFAPLLLRVFAFRLYISASTLRAITSR